MMNSQPNLYCFIDETGTDESSKFAAMALITTANPELIRTRCAELILFIQRHPQLNRFIPSVRTDGISHFHHTSDHMEIKGLFLALLKELEFDAYVIFARKDEIPAGQDKINLLLRLYKKLLLPRIQEETHRSIRVIYERLDEGAKAVEERFKSEARAMHQRIVSEKQLPGGDIQIDFDNKRELCLSVSDYICGIFSSYFKKILAGTKDSFEERHFFGISGKIRLIQDFGRRRYYSRQGSSFSMDSYLASCVSIDSEDP